MSLRLLGCALLLVVLAAFRLPGGSTGQEPSNSNQAIKWEYRELKFEGYQCAADNTGSLNKLGHEGWELVSYASLSVAFPKEAEGALLIKPAATGPGREHTPQTADSFTGTMTMKMSQSHVDGCQMIFKRLWHPTPQQPQ